MEKEVLLRVENLKKYFKGQKSKAGGDGYVKAVDDVSFDIYKGETFGLVGESGCGKSTLGRTLIRLLEPNEGKVFFHDTDMAAINKKAMKNMRRKVQIIFQDPSACLNPRRRVGEIIMEPFIIHNMYSQEERKKRIKELMDIVGLAEYHLNRYPHELSGGQKQRIGIARALALQPELIVCDEPVSALDVSVQAQVINLLEDLQKEFSLTYLFISHNLNVVYQISDRVGVMYLGKLVEIADYGELYSKRYHPYTQALLSAIPHIYRKNQGERIILQGDVPNPANPPSGCRFNTRCPKAFDRCYKEEPQLQSVEEGHLVACHLYDDQQ